MISLDCNFNESKRSVPDKRLKNSRQEEKRIRLYRADLDTIATYCAMVLVGTETRRESYKSLYAYTVQSQVYGLVKTIPGLEKLAGTPGARARRGDQHACRPTPAPPRRGQEYIRHRLLHLMKCGRKLSQPVGPGDCRRRQVGKDAVPRPGGQRFNGRHLQEVLTIIKYGSIMHFRGV